jgi:hypothetical protein
MSKKVSSQLVSAAIAAEQETGMRMCTMCDKRIPLSEFNTDKRMFKCKMHFREMQRHYNLGSVPKIAYNSIRCRAYKDMKRLFGQTSMHLSRKQIIGMLTEEQMGSFVKFCMIPRDPEKPLDINNSIIVTTIQRAYIVAGWRATHEPARYASDLEFVLSTANKAAD